MLVWKTLQALQNYNDNKNKNNKLHIMDGMELPNQEKIRTLEEKQTYKYLGILEAKTIKLVEMKEIFLK